MLVAHGGTQGCINSMCFTITRVCRAQKLGANADPRFLMWNAVSWIASIAGREKQGSDGLFPLFPACGIMVDFHVSKQTNDDIVTQSKPRDSLQMWITYAWTMKAGLQGVRIMGKARKVHLAHVPCDGRGLESQEVHMSLCIFTCTPFLTINRQPAEAYVPFRQIKQSMQSTLKALAAPVLELRASGKLHFGLFRLLDCSTYCKGYGIMLDVMWANRWMMRLSVRFGAVILIEYRPRFGGEEVV
ncbi:hypothetical protein GOP47_0012309 [Adiantum capillus-veneris]|uniref:Uncharacterized protein n=1 Tax=Adiantum capillus-veneris TaxID=13818 RepID=A0A9D4ZE69_ADICA|nr:hypothetical protein GOP47_0012309 [Adiantum capillus-veneris]